MLAQKFLHQHCFNPNNISYVHAPRNNAMQMLSRCYVSVTFAVQYKLIYMRYVQTSMWKFPLNADLLKLWHVLHGCFIWMRTSHRCSPAEQLFVYIPESSSVLWSGCWGVSPCQPGLCLAGKATEGARSTEAWQVPAMPVIQFFHNRGSPQPEHGGSLTGGLPALLIAFVSNSKLQKEQIQNLLHG